MKREYYAVGAVAFLVIGYFANKLYRDGFYDGIASGANAPGAVFVPPLRWLYGPAGSDTHRP